MQETLAAAYAAQNLIVVYLPFKGGKFLLGDPSSVGNIIVYEGDAPEWRRVLTSQAEPYHVGGCI